MDFLKKKMKELLDDDDKHYSNSHRPQSVEYQPLTRNS